ncbi:MAG TPA: LacI family DNA-binding transcriptional regulator [Pseudonocardiaceae bacterium]|nr:LacI family DNA-binding transcriptional regulator [Pseudonocardiaceae bacterium]
MSISRPSSRPPTLEHVARVAGVSRATVSRVVNGVRNVDPEMRESVERAIEATGYVPNRAARSLVTRHTGTVALVVSEPERHGQTDPFPGTVFNDPFFGRVVSGVVGGLRPHGVHPVLMLVDTPAARAGLINHLRQDHVDGVLLHSIFPDDDLPKQLTEAAIPTVLFCRPTRPAQVSYVDVAHRDGAKLAADHLVARGCRRIATISGPLDVPAGNDRLVGFRDAMARHGFPFVGCVEGNFTHQGGERAMERLLAEQPDVDGIFVGNDLMAQGAVAVLREHGRRVPDDVAVIGFDDSSAARGCRPPLTTVRQPVEDMAAEMARLLLAHIEDPDRRITSVIFEPTLVVRESA